MECQPKLSKMYSFYKISTDFLFSLIFLFLLSPILLFFCILIPIESAGSPFYTQHRLGKGGKSFKLLKLRSMYTDAEMDGPQWAGVNDTRITRVGKFIRYTRIDEIPQLFNVLKGDMSLIGPRPERYYFYQKFNQTVPEFQQRLLVKPGITGWAQVNGGYDLTPKEKLAFDLYYIKHRSISFEIKIFFRTVLIILTGNGAR
ncbi:sugar transferase [Ureibacillus acetophenoni]